MEITHNEQTIKQTNSREMNTSLAEVIIHLLSQVKFSDGFHIFVSRHSLLEFCEVSS